ncbi:SH3 domain-containing protein [Olleya sp. HaHaR_3_96]|uniref:SH3 domain-containing protein n=1 Tax=Olleya sp. HaHaR_3_96 TaxID=2745560 RepID=UPI001C4FE59D|nr:SH3 domain-containing protein [Olleya sp. HaHaR_3_96]QXP58988.1 SH3 domain-containing protein [Olleya sp. HaHaR_3_96]
MTKSIIILIAIFFLNFNNPKEKLEDFNGSYVTAESGLLCREVPNGKIIYKFPYGTEVEIIDRTDIELTITDDGKEITGDWVKVKAKNSNKTGYVFDGFLKSAWELDPQKIAELTPSHFIKTSNPKGLLLNGIYDIYDINLNITRQININKISEVIILSVTKFDRPETRKPIGNYWKEHCEWGKFLKIIYKNEEIIVFGRNILQVNSNEHKTYKTKKINFVFAENFLTNSRTSIHELSGCFSVNNILIKSDKNYSLIYDSESTKEDILTFFDNDYGSEHISSLIIKKDTIYSNVGQNFQEGIGEYKLKIFNNNNNWKFIKYDKKRDYQQD